MCLLRAGVICDDRYHPAYIVKSGIEALDLVDVDLDFIVDTSHWSGECLDHYDIIVLAKANCKSIDNPKPWLSNEVQQEFVDFVEGGRSLFVIHAGTVGYANEPLFRNLVGGGFKHHPEQSSVIINFVDKEKPSFTIHDEHYLMEMFHDDLDLFMTSTSTHGIEPAGWKRRQGEGRVCVLTPGHNLEVWTQPEYQSVITNALQWCLVR